MTDHLGHSEASPELAAHASTWATLHTTIDGLVVEAERVAQPLERAAGLLLRAQHRMPRTGMWPKLREVTSDGLHFKVSNGIDYSDDFTCRFTLAELSADVEKEQERQAARERERLEAHAVELERQAAHARKTAAEL